MAAVLAMGPRAPLGPGLALRALGWVGLALLVHGCWRGWHPGEAPRSASARDPVDGSRRMAGAAAVGMVGLLAAAVVVPPIESGDVWSYAMYGRIVAVHHASPYRHLPDEYPRDPFLARMDAVYHHTPSRYGPLFSAAAGGVAAAAHGNPLATRLLFQGLAALAALACAVVAWRKTSSIAAVALVALNPFTVLAVANGGHNDVFVGLALLGAVVLVARRPALAGAVLGAAVLVKATAVLALAGLAAWLLYRRHRAGAALFAGAAALVVLVGGALGGGASILTPLRQARLEVSKASIWHWLDRALIQRYVHQHHGLVTARLWAGREVSAVAGVAVLGTAAALLLAGRRADRDGAGAATAPVLAYLLLGAYVLPWYAVWVLPTLVAGARRRLALAVVVLAALFQMAELPGRRGPGGAPVPVTPWLHHLQSGALYLAVPVVEAAVAAALIGAAVAAARRSSPSRPGPDPAAWGRVFSQVSGR